jgi:hypothetical protein
LTLPADDNNSENLFAPPKSAAGDVIPPGCGDTEDDALRVAYSPYEASVRYIGFIHIIISCIFFITTTLLVTGIARGYRFSGATAVVSATLSFHPLFLIISILIAFGLLRFRGWAVPAVGILYLLFLAHWCIVIFRGIFTFHYSDVLFSILNLTLYSIIIYPITWPNCAEILTRDYGALVARTNHIRVRAKLPIKIKISILIYCNLICLIMFIIYKSIIILQ